MMIWAWEIRARVLLRTFSWIWPRLCLITRGERKSMTSLPRSLGFDRIATSSQDILQRRSLILMEGQEVIGTWLGREVGVSPLPSLGGMELLSRQFPTTHERYVY